MPIVSAFYFLSTPLQLSLRKVETTLTSACTEATVALATPPPPDSSTLNSCEHRHTQIHSDIQDTQVNKQTNSSANHDLPLGRFHLCSRPFPAKCQVLYNLHRSKVSSQGKFPRGDNGCHKWSHDILPFGPSCLNRQGTPSPPGSPWPMPQYWLRSNETVALNAAEFVISFTEGSAYCDVVKDAIRRTKRNIFLEPNLQIPRVSPMLAELKIRIENLTCDYPKFGDRENYTIEVPSDGDAAILTADTVWSVVRGLETFTQLIWQDKDRHYKINKTSIKDWPEYKYRGLLLDTSRHFIPVKTLLDNLVRMVLLISSK